MAGERNARGQFQRQSATDFQKALYAFQVSSARRVKDAFAISITEVRRSVVEGSTLTGAPGQPVDIGTLRGSWTDNKVAPLVWELTSGLVYTKSIEDGVSYAHGGTPLTLRSTVGGFHSVKLTRAGWDKIVAFSVERAAGRKR